MQTDREFYESLLTREKILLLQLQAVRELIKAFTDKDNVDMMMSSEAEVQVSDTKNEKL